MSTTFLILLLLLCVIIIGFGVYFFWDTSTITNDDVFVKIETPPDSTGPGPAPPDSTGPGPAPPDSTGLGPAPPDSTGLGPAPVVASPTITNGLPVSSSGTPFSLIDVNGDNFASIEELRSQNVPRLDEMFETFDINKDGNLSMSEIGEMLQSRGPPTELEDKKEYYLLTSDDKYVIKAKPRGYEFVSTGGNISKEHLKTLVNPIVVHKVPDTNNKYYIGWGSNYAINALQIRSGHYNGRDKHMVWFGGSVKPEVILPGNNNTFNIFMAEDDTSAPNIEIRHVDGDFDHDFLSQTITIGGVSQEIILTTLDEQRLKIPSPFVNSLLDGKWKFVPAS